jgi:mono/diheme cytochrome c family protein
MMMRRNMIYIRRLFTSVLTLFEFMSLATSVTFAQDPANGKVVWEEQLLCKNCHGEAGQGVWAAPLAGSEKTAQEWIEQVRNPRRNMPHFSPELVTDEMIIDVHAYLTSLTKPADFTPADAGLPPDAPEGQQLIVQKRCVACHTTTGAIPGFIKRQELPTAEAVITQLRTPRMRMPSFHPDQVSDDEATLIADFLASEVREQLPPGTLPESGQTNSSTTLPIVLLLFGSALVLAGFLFRRLLTTRA